MSSTLGLLEKCKQNQTLFISAKKARTRVKEYNDKARNMLQENISRSYVFSRNEYILNTLNSPSKLGSLKMKNEGDRRTTKIEQIEVRLMKEKNPTIGTLSIRKKEKRGEEQQTQNEEKTTKTDIFKPTKVKFMKDIKMKHKTETEGVCITGCVLMSSDLLAVADHFNASIKVVDLRSDTITCYIQLGDQLWDITCTGTATLVVTCNTNLVFLRYDGKLSVVKKVPMESGCSGITYRKGKLFVTFDRKHPLVKILNNEGKVLQTFKHNDKGQKLFSSPWYITVNRDGDTMYVSDYIQNTVTSLNMDGKVCNIYKHDKLSGPAGLTLGDDDSIYVVGWRSIHQITPTCTSVRSVVEWKDVLICPQTVLYNNTDKTLYVSNNSSSELLKVYKLE